ncbi:MULTISPECIES: hypothetical protein [unclassified Solwaraspora]|uniref:hypothetical protein n=1 Tax=unclassified Solwaraspora TaxID=2627926 RepID=UPI00259B3BA1|nr:hypothetical protein [Solwaraspora sp. WMMA2056]WJK43395.1 hypothetical protein O7608_13910 [Solwaraspora sp. WMMA2056]
MTDPGPERPLPPSAVPAGSPWAAPSPWEPPDRQSPVSPAPAASADPTVSVDPAPVQAPVAAATDPPAPTPPADPGAPYQVPAGPGAAPPFAAPPVEGRSARLWIGLSVAALAVLICCGGGTIALVGLIITGGEAINEQAQVAVDDYFDAVSQQQFGAAYGMLCAEAQRRESLDEFTDRLAAEPEIAAYEVGQVSVTSRIVVPVEVTYRQGGADTLRVSLNQDTGTGELEVCGIEE